MSKPLSLIQWTEGTAGDDLVAAVQRLDDLGYHEMWLPEIAGREPLSTCGFLLAKTSRLRISSGIANVYARDANNAAQAANALAELSGGRFTLGLGVSHPVLIEPRGHEWVPPVKKMRDFLSRYHDAPIESPRPAEPAKVIVAGHGKGLLGIARDLADGAFLFLQPATAITMARKILGPDKEIHAAVRCVLDPDPASARDLARRANAGYMSLNAYHERWSDLGFDESDWSSGGSDRLIDAICAWGDAGMLIDKLNAYREAGATHIALYPCNPDETYSPASLMSKNWHWPLLEAMAPAHA